MQYNLQQLLQDRWLGYQQGWENVERGTVVTSDVSVVVIGGSIVSEGEVKMVKGTQLSTPVRILGGRRREHNNIQHSRDSSMDKDKKNNTQIEYI